MLSSWGDHNLISLFFCEGYYKAAALTTDKLLQEHQEVNVSKLCLFYPLMTGVPNGYKVLISTALVGDCGRHVGLMVNVLYSGASSPGSSCGQGHNVLCSWARNFTLTVPLSTQVCKWVPPNLMLEVTL